MFSEKFGHEPDGPNPQWEAKLAREASGERVLDLTGSNPTLAGIPYPAGIPALLDRPSVMRYEPSPKGHPGARRAVAGYYAARGRIVDPEDLVLTASTSEAYSFLFKLLCDPGDEILIPSPTYPLFDALAGLEHVKLVRYPLLHEQRWRADFTFLRSVVSTRCKALILVHPNNPTGHLTDREEIRAYLDFAAEYGLALIVDEVFRDYLLGERPYESIESIGSNESPAATGPLVFTLNGFSKSLGLPQMKLGWIHVGGAPVAVRTALGHLEWIADAFLSVNTPIQAAAEDLLGLDFAIQTGILSRVKRNLSVADEMVNGKAANSILGMPGPAGTSGKTGAARLLNPEAGWYAILELQSPIDDEAFALELLMRRGVQVHAGHLFGFGDGCRLVLSLLGPEAEFREGMRIILDFAKESAHG